jgi:hypothetical protein
VLDRHDPKRREIDLLGKILSARAGSEQADNE